MSNWHWKTLNLKPWAESWLTEEALKVDSERLKITRLEEAEGDCELGMRKSKLVTIYDLKLRFAYTQKQPPAAEGEEAVSGTLTALEVGHDMDEDEYQFESNVGQTGDLAMQLRQEARKSLADKLRPIFQQLPKAMISAHGNTLLKDSSGGSGTSTPTVPASSTSAAATASTSSASAASAAATKSDTGKVTNTTTVKTSSPFKIAASDLFELLTDPSKVPMWTRNPAQIKPEAGAEVSLFGGNVLGKIISVNKPSQIVMTWRPPQWEAGHYGTLTMNLEQGAGETTLALKLDGVPIGTEEETERNLDTFYIRSLKQIGSVLYSTLPEPTRQQQQQQQRSTSPSSSWRQIVISTAFIALLLGLFLSQTAN